MRVLGIVERLLLGHQRYKDKLLGNADHILGQIRVHAEIHELLLLLLCLLRRLLQLVGTRQRLYDTLYLLSMLAACLFARFNNK